jgi:hypothetical protein
MPRHGLHMLPNLKFLFCGVVFGLLLFAVTGAGVMLPDSRTRVGEMPEIGRPMMQQAVAEEPAPAQFYTMTLARRSEELERLRGHASPGAAFALAEGRGPSEANRHGKSDGKSGCRQRFCKGHRSSIMQRDRASIMWGAEHGVQISPAEIAPAETKQDDTGITLNAPLPRISADSDLGASRHPTATFPPSRRIGRPNVHKRVFHRKHRVARVLRYFV